jgi:hypothetical protein
VHQDTYFIGKQYVERDVIPHCSKPFLEAILRIDEVLPCFRACQRDPN